MYVMSMNNQCCTGLQLHLYFTSENKTVYLCYIFLYRNAPEKGKLMAVFIFFPPILINIYSRLLTIINGVFSHRQKYSSKGIVSRKILVSPPFPKKSELIFSRVPLTFF